MAGLYDILIVHAVCVIAVSPQAASLLEDATKLKNEQFLILHGTADGKHYEIKKSKKMESMIFFFIRGKVVAMQVKWNIQFIDFLHMLSAKKENVL